MLLKDLLWELFQTTGQISAYLAYRECTEYGPSDPEASPD
ncbi:MAG TPA: YqzL family protein [Sporomusaceae bacterium]|nr:MULTISPECIES: YqzL family protein [Anaerospora]HAK73296.1 YqzL family protein [Sporomusaceae bacterium]